MNEPKTVGLETLKDTKACSSGDGAAHYWRARDYEVRERLNLRIPVVPHLDAAILAALSAPNAGLEMSEWHTCETKHCRAGWSIHLAGKAGYALQLHLGPAVAGSLIYAASRPHRPVPDFYSENHNAKRSLRECAKSDAAR